MEGREDKGIWKIRGKEDNGRERQTRKNRGIIFFKAFQSLRLKVSFESFAKKVV